MAGRPLERELTRRGLLAGAGGGLMAVAGLARAAEALAAIADVLPVPALSADDSQVRATMAAFADTIVPGPAGGGDSDPGALEAGALEEIYDTFYGAREVFPLLHHDLQVATPVVLGRPARFDLALPYRFRERVLLDRMTATGEEGSDLLYVLYEGTAVLVYLAYYGTARSDLGPRYIGFPPASDGYFPEHSYGVAFEGMTADGNPS